jgi:formamidopyrimidine-DNA glycosylase
MPELPEVENVRRSLQAAGVEGSKVERVELLRANLRTPFDQRLIAKTHGQRIERVWRRAKFLLFELSKDAWISHLGMTGSWRVEPKRTGVGFAALKHDHIRVHLSSGMVLVYHDPRRFGVFEAHPGKDLVHSKWLRGLGQEPLESWDGESLHASLRHRESVIKSAIMDQKVVVGVGNIYASEALFMAGIRPTRKANRVSREECGRLAQAIRKVLDKAIASGGSTIRDYRQADGQKGEFQEQLLVYGRAGLSCRQCAQPVKQKVIGGRSSFWCATCQR